MKNNDVQLIHRPLDGNENAFAELVEKYQTGLSNFRDFCNNDLIFVR